MDNLSGSQNDEAMATLGKILEKLRRDKKLQRYQVSQLTNISSSTLSGVENGEYWPDEMVWEELAKFYTLPIDMMSSMKRTASKISVTTQMELVEKAPETSAEIISFAKYREHKCQPTTSLEQD